MMPEFEEKAEKMRPNDALNEIVSIRERLEALESRNSLRSWSVAVSAIVVIVAGLWQALQPLHWSISFDEAVRSFILTWAVVFAACGIVVAGEMVWRSMNNRSALTFSWCRQLVRQLAPFCLALVLVTFAALQKSSHFSWSITEWLPGIWSMLIGLGLHSCHRLLPSNSQFAAAWLIMLGGISLSLPSWTPVQPHLVVAATLGVGQVILAITLLKGGSSHG